MEKREQPLTAGAPHWPRRAKMSIMGLGRWLSESRVCKHEDSEFSPQNTHEKARHDGALYS